jgi:glutamate 5-kinase
MHRIVVKVGSNVLTTDKGKLDITRLSALVDQIVLLREKGYEVILVSSGAVACGRQELRVEQDLDSVAQRQLFSAMGQVKLVNLYYDLFREYGLHIGQVLTMKANFEAGDQYRNQQSCIQLMLDNGVIPVVNENDTVSLTGLMFTDNDELSGLIAQMMHAETLILLSNIDGIYTGDPHDPASKLIREVQPEDNLDQYIQTKKSSAGRGGMESKYHTAREVAASGIRVMIANGKASNILPRLLLNTEATPHTEFLPSAPTK